MISQFQILIALVAGIMAGGIFFLVGRRLLAQVPEAVVQPEQPIGQRRPPMSQDELSPEAKAFIAALQQRDVTSPKADDPIWTVDIWDNRDHSSSGQSLPH